MPRKNSLLIIDGNHIKIIFGNKLKCIKFSDIKLEHNIEFLDLIFKDTDVVKVDKISRMAKEDFRNLIVSRMSKQPSTPIKQKIVGATGSNDTSGPSDPKGRVSDPIMDSDQGAAITGFVPQASGDLYVVSTDKRMTIIIDDIFTGRKISRGGSSEEETLVMEPGRPVNLASLDRESVGKSTNNGIMSRLIRNGTVRQIPRQEAIPMIEACDEKASQVISVLDWDGNSGIVGDGSPGSAEKYVGNLSKSDGVDAETIEVSMDMPPTPRPAEDIPSPMMNEDQQGSLSDLLGMIEEDTLSGKLKSQKNPFVGFSKAGGA